MSIHQKDISYKQIEMVVDILNQCTENFIYIFDLKNDVYSISSQVLQIFDLPSAKFSNASAEIDKIVFEQDKEMLQADLKALKEGKKDFHNLEYRWINKFGNPVWISCRGRVLETYGESDDLLLIGRIAIIDDKDKKDYLTQLPTEGQFRKDFAAVWTKKQKVSGFLFRIDIDNLGRINEQFSTKIGDFVLTLVSDCVKRSCKGLAVPYKLGSDEIICMNLSGGSALDANKIYQNLKRNIVEIQQKIDYDVVFTVSAGVVAFFNDSSQIDDLMKKANYSLSEAKRGGKNQLVMFNAGDYSKYQRMLALQERLRESVKNNFNGFELLYQPVVNARKMYIDEDETVLNVIGAEALLRWSSPEFGMVSPSEFVPILEETGLIIPVGRWILLTAFNQCREWNKVQSKFRMSVNISYIQVKKSDVLADVQVALARSGVNPGNITLELTESGYMDNSTQLQELVDSFRKIGLRVDIDDFGTGYSNLRYLQYLNASTLKLDYSFVHKATSGDEGDAKVIKYITEMAHELNMTVCMEGIESPEDIKKLSIYKPDKFQGYYLGKPSRADKFTENSLRPDSEVARYKKAAEENKS